MVPWLACPIFLLDSTSSPAAHTTSTLRLGPVSARATSFSPNTMLMATVEGSTDHGVCLLETEQTINHIQVIPIIHDLVAERKDGYLVIVSSAKGKGKRYLVIACRTKNFSFLFQYSQGIINDYINILKTHWYSVYILIMYSIPIMSAHGLKIQIFGRSSEIFFFFFF
jgi:hypothetical protein